MLPRRRPAFSAFSACSAALLAAATVWLSACTALAPASRPSRADDVATLTRQSDAWDRAIERKDRAAIAANMTDDFRQIGSSGETETRDSFLNDIVSDDLVIDPYTVEEFDVRVYGDTALLSGRTRMTGRYRGEPFSTHYRYIDVYVRVNGQWKVCSVQTTRIAGR